MPRERGVPGLHILQGAGRLSMFVGSVGFFGVHGFVREASSARVYRRSGASHHHKNCVNRVCKSHKTRVCSSFARSNSLCAVVRWCQLTPWGRCTFPLGSSDLCMADAGDMASSS